MFDVQTEAASVAAVRSVMTLVIRRSRVLNNNNTTVDRRSRRPARRPSTPASLTTINTWVRAYHFQFYSVSQKKRATVSDCNSAWRSSDVCDLCTVANRNEYSTVCLVNGLMTSWLHHIACHEIATIVVMLSAVQDNRGRPLPGARLIDAVVRSFRRKWSIIRLFPILVRNLFYQSSGRKSFTFPQDFLSKFFFRTQHV